MSCAGGVSGQGGTLAAMNSACWPDLGRIVNGAGWVGVELAPDPQAPPSSAIRSEAATLLDGGS